MVYVFSSIHLGFEIYKDVTWLHNSILQIEVVFFSGEGLGGDDLG